MLTIEEQQILDLMRLSNQPRTICQKALNENNSAYDALKYLMNKTASEAINEADEITAKLQNKPPIKETLEKSNQILKEHSHMLTTSDHTAPDNVHDLCENLGICPECLDSLHGAGLIRQPDELCYGNGTTNFSEDDNTKQDQMQGYRLKMAYDDLVFVTGQLQQLNDEGTINNLEYTVDSLNRAMQLLNVAIKQHNLNPDDTELQEAANYSTVNEALDDLNDKTTPPDPCPRENTNCCQLDTDTLLNECDNAIDFLNDCIDYTQEDEIQGGVNVCMHVARKSIQRVKAALNMQHRITAPNCLAPDSALNNTARNCCTEFNEQSTRYTKLPDDLPDYATNPLNANNLAWSKLADQYEKLLNMFRLILHQQTSLLSHLIMKDAPQDENNPNYGNDPYYPHGCNQHRS